MCSVQYYKYKLLLQRILQHLGNAINQAPICLFTLTFYLPAGEKSVFFFTSHIYLHVLQVQMHRGSSLCAKHHERFVSLQS